jgi:hypothetical protein
MFLTCASVFIVGCDSDSLWAGWSADEIPSGGEVAGSEIFYIHADQPWGPCSLLYSGYQVIPRGKVAGAWH